MGLEPVLTRRIFRIVRDRLRPALSPERATDSNGCPRDRRPAWSKVAGQDALGLTQRSVEEETERQGGFDGEIGILELPAPPADASRCPRGDRVRREPEGDVASPHEGSVVLGPGPDAILCLVLRMHSRLHIEIMTRRRSRWSTCRPLLAHRAESAHQRRYEPSGRQWAMRFLAQVKDMAVSELYLTELRIDSTTETWAVAT